MVNVVQVTATGTEFSASFNDNVEALKFAKQCEKDAEKRGIDEILIESPEKGCLWYVSTAMFTYYITLEGVHPFWVSTREMAKTVISTERDRLVSFFVEIRTEPEYGWQNHIYEDMCAIFS